MGEKFMSKEVTVDYVRCPECSYVYMNNFR